MIGAHPQFEASHPARTAEAGTATLGGRVLVGLPNRYLPSATPTVTQLHFGHDTRDIGRETRRGLRIRRWIETVQVSPQALDQPHRVSLGRSDSTRGGDHVGHRVSERR